MKQFIGMKCLMENKVYVVYDIEKFQTKYEIKNIPNQYTLLMDNDDNSTGIFVFSDQIKKFIDDYNEQINHINDII